jgi:hypothetical protein
LAYYKLEASRTIREMESVVTGFDADIKLAEDARRRLLRPLCPTWLRRALDDAHHNLATARRRASKPAPTPPLRSGVIVSEYGELLVSTDAPEHWQALHDYNEKLLDHADGIAAAQAEVDRLQGVYDALKQLALQPVPSVEQMNKILAENAGD